MVTIYNTTISATSQRHFSDGLGGGGIRITFLLLRLIYGALQRPVTQAGN